MRIERISVKSFGRFEGLDSGDEPLGRLNVVTGPNESGKSTFFSLLTSLLYGFQPASYDRHPYAPWNGSAIEGQAKLRLDDGTSATLTRKLVASPWGRLKADGVETDLRNRALPFLAHIPRAVFMQVYALTLSELGRLEGATWATIQERMIASLIADDVRSAATVVEELKSEAGSLWRPNRRGQQTARALNEQIRQHQNRRREAGERDQRVRELDERLGEARMRLREFRTERAALMSTTEQLERLLPDAQRLERLRTLEEPVIELTPDLPLDPSRELERLRRELEGATRRAEHLESQASALGRRQAELDQERHRYGADGEELQALRRRAVDAVLSERAVRDLEGELQALPIPSHPPAPQPLTPSRAWALPAAVVAGVLFGAVSLLIWAGAGRLPWALLGVALWVVGGSAGFLGVRASRRAQAEELERVAKEAADRERRGRRADVERRLTEQRSELDETTRPIEVFLHSRDLDATGGAEALVDTLDGLARGLGRWSLEARSSREAQTRVDADRASAQAAVVTLESELRSLEARLSDLGAGSVEQGIAAMARFHTQSAEVLRLKESIQERHGSPDQLADEVARFEVELGGIHAEALSDRRARVQELSEEIEDVRSEITALEKDIAHLSAGASVSEIDAEIESLKEQRHQQERERDRKVLLARVLEESDRRFRERHQPDVIRRGAEYIAHITGGRYRALKTGDGGDDAMLYVQQREGPPRDVSGPLSTGTKEQIYLALRLAVIDHLDHDRERLPLFLDESFVNWDAERRNQGLRLLRSLAQHRQIFVFTCHQDTSDRLQALGARVLRLGDGEQVELW